MASASLSKEQLRNVVDGLNRQERIAFCKKYGVSATKTVYKSVDEMTRDLGTKQIEVKNLSEYERSLMVVDTDPDFLLRQKQKEETADAKSDTKSSDTYSDITEALVLSIRGQVRTETCDAVRRVAEWVGCKPRFCPGMFGLTWHCGCCAHEIDTQCSMLDINLIIDLALTKLKTKKH